VAAMRVTGVEEQAMESSVVSRHLVAVDPKVSAPTGPRLHPARWFLFTDLSFGLVAYGLALTFHAEVVAVGEALPLDPSWSMLVPLLITFVVFHALGLYERELLAHRALHLLTLAKAMLWSAAISALVVYLLHLPVAFESRFTAVGAFAFFFVFAAVVRTLVLSRVLGRRFREDMGRTLVVGWPYRTEPLRERLTMLNGFDRVDLVDGGREQHVAARVDQHLSGQSGDRRLAVGSLFVDARSVAIAETLDLIAVGRRHGVTVYVVSNRLRPLAGRRLLIDLFEAPVVRVRRAPGERRRAPLKRATDVVVSAGALIALSPLLLVCALAVKLTSRGPVLYAQERIGLGGGPFKLYKFRSMRHGVGADAHREYMRALINGEAETRTQRVEGEEQEVFKLVDDPRVTAVGRFLRRYSLDEIPQFWNVWLGDMSLVGPRPALQSEVEQYDDHVLRRLDVRPGLTGLWQVSGRSDLSWEDTVRLDLYYVDNWSMMQDLAILGRTANAVLASRGAY